MRYRVLVMFIPLLLLVACGPAPEATSPATPTAVLAPTEPPTSTPAAESEPTEPSPPTPTVLPTLVTAATPTAAPSPIPQAGGTAGFRDNLATADQFILELANVSAPPDGQAY